MKIRSVSVTAGRTFNHPYEQYSNLRPEVQLVAEIGDEDDPIASAKELQQTAETLVEDHKRAMLRSIEELAQMQRAQRELAELGRVMRQQQDRIDALRKEHPGIETFALGEPVDTDADH